MADARWKAYGAAAIVFALDRASKWIVERYVSPDDAYRVIPGFFDIVHSQNRGVAFGLFNNSTSEWRTAILIVLSSAALALVGAVLWRTPAMDRLTMAGLSLILGGAAGNVFDRVAWGRVTDFLELHVGDYHWPTFNVADSAIVIGSGLLLIELFRPKRAAART